MRYRVDVSITIDVEANDMAHAEVCALEQIDFPSASVEQIICLESDAKQSELFE